MTEPLTPGVSHRRGRRASIVALAALAILVVLGVTRIHLSDAAAALGHASPGWVAVAVVVFAGSFFARAESWSAVLHAAVPGSDIARRTVTHSLLIGMAASTLAPARVGEGVRTWLVARRISCPDGVMTVLGTVLAQTLFNVVALALLAVVTLSALSTHGWSLSSVAIVVALPAGVGLLLLLTARHRRTGAGVPLPAPGASRRTRFTAWVLARLAGAGRGLTVCTQPAGLVHAGGTQLLAWALQWAAADSVLLALHLHLHAAPAVAAAAVLLAVNLTAILPVTPANVGVFQAVCIAVLTPLGVGAGAALAYGLLLQGIEVVLALTLGAAALVREGLSLRDVGTREGRRRLALARG
ncbi:lysylphosphatidylglycerol synthase transmembrane domain-containing protein [Conexibacter sp. DBS9H8]|uniref:lysylphosphatidylglycerol synthase transmembrane domain-containing protein n=1 Tax=Conexibacter sp. DBS9H8 TaxID=2937801 RepID=UPI00200EE961|nr:lysylphosphatidylglycerol synthase transmembrane domain-containing protein [Conexibacter sp. DBS9H8]